MRDRPTFIRSVADFTLDTGKCPPWLFERMVRLSRVVIIAIVEEFGPGELLMRLADPVWFQSLGTLLAFDWNASGLTTTTLAALKTAIFGLEKDLGIFICGGKGKSSRKTPTEIEKWAEVLGLSKERYTAFIKASKLSAKVDNSLVQDGFTLYHHNFIFTINGDWVVIQQGMNTSLSRARRYHWFSRNVKDFTDSPHSGIESEIKLPRVFNLVLEEAKENKKGILELTKHKKQLFYEIKRLTNIKSGVQLNLLNLSSEDFSFHPIENKAFSLDRVEDFFSNKRVLKSINEVADKQPEKFEDLLLTQGVGPKTIRALSLVAEVIFGAKPSYEDPIRYSYAFGGKDGVPYPVNRKRYDKIIEVLEKALKKARLPYYEKEKALRKVEKVF